MPEQNPSGPGSAGSDPAPARPVLRLIRGTATDEELAALVTVIAAASAAAVGGEPAAPSRSRWADVGATVCAPLAPGPGAWQAVYRRR